MRKGEVTFEMVPQGTLVEHLRAAGEHGLAAVYTPTGLGTAIADGKEVRYFDGKPYLLETALSVDYASIAGHRADRLGNVEFRGANQHFGPSFAKAARVAIVEVDEVVEPGEIPAERIGLPASSSRVSSARPWSARCPSTVLRAATATFPAPTTASPPGRGGRWRNWPPRSCPKAPTSTSASAYRATCLSRSFLSRPALRHVASRTG